MTDRIPYNDSPDKLPDPYERTRREDAMAERRFEDERERQTGD